MQARDAQARARTLSNYKAGATGRDWAPSVEYPVHPIAANLIGRVARRHTDYDAYLFSAPPVAAYAVDDAPSRLFSFAATDPKGASSAPRSPPISPSFVNQAIQAALRTTAAVAVFGDARVAHMSGQRFTVTSARATYVTSIMQTGNAPGMSELLSMHSHYSATRAYLRPTNELQRKAWEDTGKTALKAFAPPEGSDAAKSLALLCSQHQYFGSKEAGAQPPPHAASAGDRRAVFDANGAAPIGKIYDRHERRDKEEMPPEVVKFLLYNDDAFSGLPPWAADAVRAVVAIAATVHARAGATLRLLVRDVVDPSGTVYSRIRERHVKGSFASDMERINALRKEASSEAAGAARMFPELAERAKRIAAFIRAEGGKTKEDEIFLELVNVAGPALSSKTEGPRAFVDADVAEGLAAVERRFLGRRGVAALDGSEGAYARAAALSTAPAQRMWQPNERAAVVAAFARARSGRASEARIDWAAVRLDALNHGMLPWRSNKDCSALIDRLNLRHATETQLACVLQEEEYKATRATEATQRGVDDLAHVAREERTFVDLRTRALNGDAAAKQEYADVVLNLKRAPKVSKMMAAAMRGKSEADMQAEEQRHEQRHDFVEFVDGNDGERCDADADHASSLAQHDGALADCNEYIEAPASACGFDASQHTGLQELDDDSTDFEGSRAREDDDIGADDASTVISCGLASSGDAEITTQSPSKARARSPSCASPSSDTSGQLSGSDSDNDVVIISSDSDSEVDISGSATPRGDLGQGRPSSYTKPRAAAAAAHTSDIEILGHADDSAIVPREPLSLGKPRADGSPRLEWTENENLLLLDAVGKYGRGNAVAIYNSLPDWIRTARTRAHIIERLKTRSNLPASSKKPTGKGAFLQRVAAADEAFRLQRANAAKGAGAHYAVAAAKAIGAADAERRSQQAADRVLDIARRAEAARIAAASQTWPSSPAAQGTTPAQPLSPPAWRQPPPAAPTAPPPAAPTAPPPPPHYHAACQRPPPAAPTAPPAPHPPQMQRQVSPPPSPPQARAAAGAFTTPPTARPAGASQLESACAGGDEKLSHSPHLLTRPLNIHMAPLQHSSRSRARTINASQLTAARSPPQQRQRRAKPRRASPLTGSEMTRRRCSQPRRGRGSCPEAWAHGVVQTGASACACPSATLRTQPS